MREDLFTVVFDPVLTDTARYADVVLPATTFLEREELSRGYGAFVLQQVRAVIDPVGESRPNHEVFAELCRRTGVARAGRPCNGGGADPGDPGAERGGSRDRESPGRERRRVSEGQPSAGPVRGRLSADARTARSVSSRRNWRPRRRRACTGSNPTRRRTAIRWRSISPATDRTISSTLGELRRDSAVIEIHPDDAGRRGISDGDAVRVFNDRGEVRCRARRNATLRPGVAMLPKGLWRHNTDNGATATALAPDTLTDLGGGACFNDARVEIERSGF